MRSILAAMLLACASVPHLDGQTVRDFAGTYDLVRFELVNDEGEWEPTTRTFGPNPVGIIMYDGVGSMSVHIVSRDREAESPPGGYMAYYGGYDVDPVQRTVTHWRENHTNPDQATEPAVRGFDFDGDLLILTVEPARELRVIWRKRR